MHNAIRLSFIGFFFFLGLSTSHAQESGALSKTRGELQSTMSKWQEHRSQKIVVLDIQGLSDGESSGGELERLESRLKTLLNKTRSNREWKSYWKDEARFAAEVIAFYDKLSPLQGQGALSSEAARLTKESKAADLTAEAKQTAFTAAMGAQRKARQAVQATFNTLDEALRNLPAQVKTLEGLVDGLTKKVSKSKKALLKARTPTDKEKLGADLDAVAEQLKSAVAEQEQVNVSLQTLEKTRQALDAAIKGDAVDIEGIDAAVAKVIKAYEAAVTTANARSSEQKSTQKEATSIHELSQTLTLEDTRYRARRTALKSWQQLAQKKVSNQDTYYKAIQSDIEAVRDRLRSFRKTQEPEEVERAEDVCTRPLGEEETSLQHFRACVAATKTEIEVLKQTLEQRKASNKLTERLLDSTKNLLQAQRKDEELVEEEHRISQTEAERAEAPKAREAATWTSVWKVYASNAKGKIASLSKAVISSKETQRALNVNRGLHESEMSLLDEKLSALETALAERDDVMGLIGSLFATSWELVRIGWPALIYLFLAWLALRLTRRVSDKVIRQAEGTDDDDAAFKSLQSALTEAEAATDLERINDVRDQMTIHESRRRDAAQRVTTLTNIAGGAVKVVVYIASALLVLDALTVDVGPILGGAAIFGLAISFGSQSLVKDVVTGFFILLENQYAVGDVVSINGQSGGVESITLRRTVLRDVKGGVHNIPNGTISSVINSTQGWARAVVHLGVAYGTDMEKVEEVVNGVGDAMYADPDWNAKVMEPPRYVGITAFNDSDITFRAMFKTHTFENWGAEREFNRRIKVAFEAASIEIPFPQREVHLISDNA
jgi:small-conductance mechanosensitive channel